VALYAAMRANRLWASRVARSVLRGRKRRMRPMAFSMPPFCQGRGGRRRRSGCPSR
jgi:hypothetical protein